MTGQNQFFHLVYYGFERTVIDSQVITPALKLQKEGLSVRLIFFEDLRTWLMFLFPSRRRARKVLLRGLHGYFLPRCPRNFFYGNTVLAAFMLFPAVLKRGSTVIHARGFQGTAVLLPLRRLFSSLRLICDARGVEAEEYAHVIRARKNRPLRGVETWWKRTLEAIENRTCERADAVFCVSKAMIAALRARVHRADDRWEYVPCAVDVQAFSSAATERFAIRAKMGLQQKTVVVYSGAINGWQPPAPLAALFLTMFGIDPACFFLGLTPQPQLLEAEFKTRGISETNFLMRTARFEEVPALLAAADIGLLIREESPVNRYACPTKFAEYLASGLHVLATPAIEDIAAIIKEDRVGTLLDFKNEAALRNGLSAALVAARDQGRAARSRDSARRRLDWSIYVPRIKKWYLELAAQKYGG